MSVDFATLGGLVIGITVVLLAILTQSDISIFINVPSILIVAGGTFAATLIKFPLSGVLILPKPKARMYIRDILLKYVLGKRYQTIELVF